VAENLTLTVVIPTTRGRAALVRCLESLVPQAVAHAGKALVVDGSGESAPVAAPPLDWVTAPREGVFALRRRGMQLATSPPVMPGNSTSPACRESIAPGSRGTLGFS
jgi:hypothetical protein